MAATRGDGQTDVPVSVAELCRRLGPVPATADSVATGATPLLIGDLLRREGRPEVGPDPFAPAPVVAVPEARRAPSPRAAPDDDPPAVPAPRRRGDACKTALGAGGLVVAGSVLGAALLAAAGVGGALPVPPGRDDGTGQFQGEGTLGRPGTAYGSVSGRDVVAGRRAGAGDQLLPAVHGRPAPHGRPEDRASPAVLPLASVPVARAVVPAQALAPASGDSRGGRADTAGRPGRPRPSPRSWAGSTQTVTPVTEARSVRRRCVGPGFAAVVAPAVAGVAGTIVQPVAETVGTGRQPGGRAARRLPHRSSSRSCRSRHRSSTPCAGRPGPFWPRPRPVIRPALAVHRSRPSRPVAGRRGARSRRRRIRSLQPAARSSPIRSRRGVGRHRAAAGRRVGAADAGHPDGAVHADGATSAAAGRDRCRRLRRRGRDRTVGAATEVVAPSETPGGGPPHHAAPDRGRRPARRSWRTTVAAARLLPRSFLPATEPGAVGRPRPRSRSRIVQRRASRHRRCDRGRRRSDGAQEPHRRSGHRSRLLAQQRVRTSREHRRSGDVGSDGGGLSNAGVVRHRPAERTRLPRPDDKAVHLLGR